MNASATGALVVGDDYRALAIARSLGRRGIPVWLLADRAAGPGQYSRYCRRRLSWLGHSPDARVATLAEVGARDELRGWVVFPTDDSSAELLGRQHELLHPHLQVTVPPWPQLREALDKRRAGAAAVASGVDLPQTWQISSLEEARTAEVGFPAILKPAIKDTVNEFTEQRAWRVDTREQLLERFAAACSMVDASDVIVQELLPGGGETQFSFAALCHEGTVLAQLVARRARQFPTDFGHSSTFVEVVENDAVKAAATRLLAQLGYSGLVEVEFKLDTRRGRFALLDVNPRMWTWCALGGYAGVDFPYLAWRHYTGQEVPPTHARVGARWVRALTDVPAALDGLRRHQLSWHDYRAGVAGPKVGVVFARDDAVPGLADVPLVALRSARRTFGFSD